jgi:hypothetical protein
MSRSSAAGRPVVALATVMLGLALTGAAGAPAAHATVPAEPRDRVAHHLRAVDAIGHHLDALLRDDCERFASARQWKAYFDGEVDRVVLLMAHLEQAWLEAKKTPDDEIRRTAKAPRKRLHEARPLLAKLQACADENDTSFTPLAVWRRIARDVPQRQAEIALPD